MSLLPMLLNDILDDYRRPNLSDIYDQHFGLGLLDDELTRPRGLALSAPMRCGYLRPWRNMAAGDSGLSSMTSNKNEFKVNLDVQQFKPEELSVKVENGFIVVDGKHEERSDQHGFISRQFTRRYNIPDDVEPDALVSKLSSDGVLSLAAPKKKIKNSEARDIPITQTHAPAVKHTKEPGKKDQAKMEE